MHLDEQISVTLRGFALTLVLVLNLAGPADALHAAEEATAEDAAAGQVSAEPAEHADLEEIERLMELIQTRLDAMGEAAAAGDKALEFLTKQVDEAVSSLSDEEDQNDSLQQRTAELETVVNDLAHSRDALEDELGRTKSERDTVVAELVDQVAALSDMLSLEKEAKEDLDAQLVDLAAELRATLGEKDALDGELALARKLIATRDQSILAQAQDLTAQRKRHDLLAAKLAALEGARDEETRLTEEAQARVLRLNRQIAEQQAHQEELTARLAAAQGAHDEETRLTEAAQARVLLLNRQIAALRAQLAALAITLEATEAKNSRNDVQIADLSRRLNVALASKAQELARYRSEFFGRLRAVLGGREDVRIVGDRFVFQSEVLFDSGSAELGESGRRQLAQLAATFQGIATDIPESIPWVLRVDGHTDHRAISTAVFPSNWELSTARAISVVKFLIDQGIPADHLAATGFGEFRPLDLGTSEASLRRNRRIEFKLTQ
jgi:chemotaxis protein MotB